MSLAINTDDVTAVLLADGWHDVSNSSFDIDSYEYIWEDDLVFGGGRDPLIPASGFSFSDALGRRIAGPLTSVLAVRTR
ncbi:hypothetical protein A5768_08265 [Mycolicibacterium fortuitum]|uniref:hypothetical protein n=1 Tax=Mycolicibacterium TaxID=1866885 RepID=UPI0007EC0831|nr:hypothetical protein [Mycolicibacterium fortuitum]OBG14840.1 hypothetical protein A5768_08265 [Mycolicibacterium fortuitum]